MRSIQVNILVILLGTVASSSSAQELLVDGAEWHYNLWYFGSNDVGFNRCFIEGDTMILDKKCLVYKQEAYNCNGRPLKNYLHKEKEKIYFFDEVEQQFKLLYDFSLKAGDTMRLETWEHLGNQTFYIHIDSVTEFAANARKLKMFHITYGYLDDHGEIHYYHDFNSSASIIEEIGSTQNFFHFWDNGFCDFTISNELRCFAAPEFPGIQIGPDDCTTVPAVDIVRDQRIWIYPNPTSGEVTIDVGQDGLVACALFDLEGNLLIDVDHKRKTKKVILDLEGYENCVYILKVITEAEGRQKIISEKIVTMGK